MVCHYLKIQIIKHSQYYVHWTILSQFLLLCFMLIWNQMHQMVLREIFSTSSFFLNKVAFIIMVTYYQRQSTTFAVMLQLGHLWKRSRIILAVTPMRDGEYEGRVVFHWSVWPCQMILISVWDFNKSIT